MNDMLVSEDVPVRKAQSSHYNIYVTKDYVIFVPLAKPINALIKTPAYLYGAVGGVISSAAEEVISRSKRKKSLAQLKDYTLEQIMDIPEAVGTYGNQVIFNEQKRGVEVIIGEYVFVLDSDTAANLYKSIRTIK